MIKSLTILAALLTLSILPGCNIIAPVAYAIHGPEKINPVYTLPENATTVIFVDDPSSKIAQRRLRYAMADVATKQLLEKRIVTDMLDPQGIIATASKDSHNALTSMSDLGKAVGADIVIYAVVTNFSLSPESGSYIPRATLNVKVIDVAQGKRVWPESNFGHPVEIQIPQRPGLNPDQGAAQLAMEQQLAARAGLGLSQLFYRHESTETVLFRR